MEQSYPVKLKTVVEELELIVVHAAKNYEEVQIDTSEVNRPGLQLTGFYDYFDPRRIQIMGKVEITYLYTLSEEERKKMIDDFMSRELTAVIICHGMEVPVECLDAAEKYDVNLLKTDVPTSDAMAQLISTLGVHLAPRTAMHAVLVEVHGEGLLITGDSGVGKSETALELIKRGHRLIADDAVEIKRTSSTTLVGSAPEIIRYYMELRGIGVIDARRIFGVGSVKPSERIDLVVNLEPWKTDKAYDRLGIDLEYTTILGVKIPSVTIPVGPGRNLAVILEVAAMNNRQKKMGYNAALELVENHDRMVNNEELIPPEF
ncbi:MAG: HPr(Ser) kinase/phosphatase [Oscillospiraceae bacterium]|jgi:HPr kinase/phosphorylase